MNIPITVSVPLTVPRADVKKWLDSIGRTDAVFLFPYYTISFEQEADAIAFMLAFDAKRMETKIEQFFRSAKLDT